jgi:hypothetical protein
MTAMTHWAIADADRALEPEKLRPPEAGADPAKDLTPLTGGGELPYSLPLRLKINAWGQRQVTARPSSYGS